MASVAGEDWSRLEVEAIVADYKVMLNHEIRGEPFVKMDHIRGMMKLLSVRNKGSIQFKYANISAALRDLGLPFVNGFKPRGNYQRLLFEVVDNWVRNDFPFLAMIKAQVDEPLPPPPVSPNILSARVKPPSPDREEYPEKRKVREGAHLNPIDYIAREARNQALGRSGETFVLEYERARLTAEGKANLADRVEWVSADIGDWYGFDVKSFETNGRDRLIEVKTTRYGIRTPFYASRNEVTTSIDMEDRYHLYRTFDFDKGAKLFILSGRLDHTCRLDPVTFEAMVG